MLKQQATKDPRLLREEALQRQESFYKAKIKQLRKKQKACIDEFCETYSITDFIGELNSQLEEVMKGSNLPEFTQPGLQKRSECNLSVATLLSKMHDFHMQLNTCEMELNLISFQH